jgi:hypothetical protein
MKSTPDQLASGHPLHFAVAVAVPAAEPAKLPQGSILQNSISAENFFDKFSFSNFAQLSAQKTTCRNFLQKWSVEKKIKKI